jgi:hypothetical protein
MQTNAISLNPFSLMMEPELVLKAMERSKSLRALRRHKLRPLDKPLIPYSKEKRASDAAALARGSVLDESELDD